MRAQTLGGRAGPLAPPPGALLARPLPKLLPLLPLIPLLLPLSLLLALPTPTPPPINLFLAGELMVGAPAASARGGRCYSLRRPFGAPSRPSSIHF